MCLPIELKVDTTKGLQQVSLGFLHVRLNVDTT